MPTKFIDLPLEIRQSIWLFSLPADEPEVCLVWPVKLRRFYDDYETRPPAQPFVVDTGFPVAMHVCRESRAIARNQVLSGLRFRSSTAAGCPVPFRAFRPELDTMYWGSENIGALPSQKGKLPVLNHVRHLAVELPWGFHQNDDEFPMMLTENLPALRTLSLVVPDSTPASSVLTGPNGSCPRKSFRQPARRCKLRHLSPEEGANIRVIPPCLWEKWWQLREEDLDEEEMPLVPTALEEGRMSLDVTLLVRDENGMFMDGGPSQLHNLKMLAQTFIEYQKDGSWKEICAERSWVQTEVRILRSGAELSYNQRPDPEKVRVNDIDGDFKLVYQFGSDNGESDSDVGESDAELSESDTSV